MENKKNTLLSHQIKPTQALLKQYGPDVSEEILLKLIGSFSELRAMSDAGTFLYPYSTRELVNIVKHMQVRDF